ncbi:coiled-coil domain-containing protein 81-like [Gymnogyps californianus]|uniref:coiled-coil domain-containing protein 81-like n=1 Tax=Gymnogyps californianus TaxID=33616 RepID=UPI0021C8B79C|nr:coiled-coil domain-containing protein 81-like [Gymnogyps californianus]
MTNLEALVTNIELCSKTGGSSAVTFPTLKKLSVSDVVAIWSSVSKHVRQQLLQRKPQAVSITGLGTFHIQKWLSSENGEVLAFQRPVFSLSRTVARIRELQHASVPLPGEIKKVSVNYKKIHSDAPYSEEVVQNCMQETLNFFYFILTNREDTDFILKDVGTLAIRGTEVTMAFCEDFLISLNRSTYVVQKLLAKKWVVSDKDVALSPSHFGRVHQFPQFEIRTVPRRASLTAEKICTEFDSVLSRMGIREAVCHTLRRLRRGVSTDRLARAEMEEEAQEKMEGQGLPGRLLSKGAGTEGRQPKETPFESPELPLPLSEERRQTGQKGQSVFGLNGRRKLEASMAKRKEIEENSKAGRVILPELPQQQAGRESDKMQRAQLPQEEEGSLSSPETTSDTEEGLQTVEAWTEARRQFRTELESFGDVEKWLTQKPSLSNQEERFWQRLKARRADRRAAVKSAVSDSPDVSTESSQPWKKGSIPLVCAPYPQALVTLHNLLHKKKLRMVDVFKKAGMDGRKIQRAAFIKVIKETKVPISEKDLEDVVIFLTSSKPGNFISPKDLIDCQKQWLEMRKGQSQETKTGVEAQFQKATCKTATCPPSAGGTAKGMKPHAPTKPERKLIHLEVPPVNTEPERRHLSYDEMEEIGKLMRERRRWEKNKDSPIEQKEKCRLVRSGDGPIDDHCLPSTVEADLGELVDRYRRNAFMSYLKSSKLCTERNVDITEPTLQKALLHPGDKIIKVGEDIRKIRQPGGYYSTGGADAPLPGSTSRSGTAAGSQAKEAENRFVQRGLKISPLLLPCCASPLCAHSPRHQRQCRGIGVNR